MLRQWIARSLRKAPGVLHDPVNGGLMAICLATICQQLIVMLGTSLPVWVALVLAVSLGCSAGLSRRLWTRSHSALPAGSALLPLALTVWMVATPWALQLTDWLLARPGLLSASTGPRNTALLLAVCLVLAAIPAALCTRLAWRSATASPSATPAGMLCGAAVGLTLWAFGLAQVTGPWYCGIAAAGLSLAIVTVRLLRQSDTNDEPLTEATRAARNQPGSAAGQFSPVATWVATVFELLLAIGCGGLLAASSQILDQLLPGTVYLTSAEVIGILIGLSLGCRLASSRLPGSANPEQRALLASCGLALHSVLLVAAFPLLVLTALWLNAYIAATPLLLAGRGLIAGLVMLPIGVVASLCVAVRSTGTAGKSWNQRGGRVSLWLIGGAAGCCVVAPSGELGFSPEGTIIALAWGVALTAALRYARRHTIPTRWPARGVCTGLAALIVAAPLWRTNCDPRLSSRLLFNTNVFVAYRMGYGPDLLPCLDEGRHVATLYGARGTTTVWKFGGAQLQIRENGIPTGVISCDPQVFPRFAAETLPAAWPMILHLKPQSLLLLGLGSGESLSAGLSFPLPEISCWEPDASHARVLSEVVAAHSGVNLLDDERVRLTIADPALALDAEPGTFDVVVSSPGHLALLRAQPYLTQTFYRRVARRLAPEGVFCQRLQMIDLGPRPLQSVVRTMQSVFHEVLALEVAPGEMLLAATNNRQGLIQPKLTERLQLPHVQSLLGQSGVDWSVLVNLTAYRNDGLAEFAGMESRRPNLADNSRLPFSLPREVMRWAPKYDEVHAALAPIAGRLVAWIGDEGTSPMLVRRLAEVSGQHDLMTKYSDQYWSYRATLRTQITTKPRSKVEQASLTSDRGQMHPEDRRRRDYFVALGRAIKTRNVFDVQRLERFEFPYDPLLSYFLHQEAAELYARAGDRDVVQELRHRLHAVWFSSPRDASLQNVIATLQLLREYPAAEPDPARRWDTLNALLQALQQRWEARANVTPTDVKAVINDIDATVIATEKTFATLDDLTREVQWPSELWAARRSALERNLIRPVKSYRSDLLPHLHRKKTAAAKETDDSPDRAAAPTGSVPE
ncbi:MAG: hypothetical protein EXS05_02055 [Planctomycetaceae bacterium]|nr:hypothetical protein [Planctomycetaceae bacterium]